MQPTERKGRRSIVSAGIVFALSCFLSMSHPAAAQIDIGDWVLLTGTWNREAAPVPAWFNLSTWTVAVEMKGALPRVASDPEPLPWIPVAGDFDGDGLDSVMMFEPATWRLAPAERGPVEAAADPQPNPWVPVAGDWDGRGIDTIRVFDLRDGSLHALEEGPLRLVDYEPEPNPWRPLVGDFTGRGIDTVAVWRNGERSGFDPDWVQVAGDWDGDGIDTLGTVYAPSGDLVPLQPALFASRAVATTSTDSNGPASIFGADGTCWSFSKKIAQKEILVNLGYGACSWIVLTVTDEWKCCPIAPPNPKNLAICSHKLKFSSQESTGSC